MAGTGKSTISRTLAHSLHRHNLLGGTFLFSRSSGDANNASKFVGTLAYCLANVSPHLRACICEVIASHTDILRQGLRIQWEKLIIQPLTKARFDKGKAVNFVVDALDECGSDNEIRILIQLFAEVKSVSNVQIGVFVTSRPEVVIRLGFKNMPSITHQDLDLRDVPREVVEHDISVFVKTKLSQTALERELIGWPSETELRALVKNAGCLFIYAATACRFIADTSWDPSERLSDVVQGYSTGGVEIAQLDTMYTHVLESSLIAGRSAPDATKLCDRFREVVGPIVVLYDEFSISSLAQLLSTQASWVANCLNTLHSVLNVPKDSTSPIRLLHPSLRDFLLSKSRCGGKDFFVDEAGVHSALLTRCLEVITVSLKRNMCSLPTPGSSAQDVDQAVLDERLPKHVRYACRYWVDHLKAAGKASLPRVNFYDDGNIQRFLEKDFLHWLEAMSLMGSMTQAVIIITEITAMIEVRVLSSVFVTSSTFRNQIY